MYNLFQKIAQATPATDAWKPTNEDINLPNIPLTDASVGSGLQIALIIAAILAVIFIAVGGLKYTTSGGDANQISSAKNTILYALVGLVVALFALTIVSFVLGNFS